MSDLAPTEDWVVLDLDATAAARASLPARIVAPSDAPELRDGALTRAVAASWASRFLQSHPSDPIAPTLRALVEKEGTWRAAEDALAAEDWDSAMPHLDAILKIDPQDAAARFNHASGLRARGDAKAALSAFQGIRAVFDSEGVYHANVARTYQELGRTDEAIKGYRRALELIPGDQFVLDRLVELGALAVAADEDGNPVYLDPADLERAVREDLAARADDPEYLVEAAKGLIDAGNPDLARNAAQLALAADGQREDARLLLAIALGQLGRHRDAIVELDRHVEAVPASALGHANRAQVLMQLDRRAEARGAAERALELDPNAVPAVQIAIAGNDGPEAVLARAVEVATRHPRAWAPARVAGDLSLHLDRVEEAVGHYLRAVDLGADEASVAAIMGALGQRGRIEDVCRIADDLPRLVSRDAGVRWNAAFAYEQAGRSDEARIVFASIAHDETAAPDLRETARQRVDALAPASAPPPPLAADDAPDEA